MKVRAKRLGYYGHKRRKEGAEFVIQSDKDFSESWMEQVGGESPSGKSKKRNKKDKDENPENSEGGESPSGDSDVL